MFFMLYSIKFNQFQTIYESDKFIKFYDDLYAQLINLKLNFTRIKKISSPFLQNLFLFLLTYYHLMLKKKSIFNNFFVIKIYLSK